MTLAITPVCLSVYSGHMFKRFFIKMNLPLLHQKKSIIGAQAHVSRAWSSGDILYLAPASCYEDIYDHQYSVD